MAKRFVDVSHEALIRGWPRLRRWLDEDRVGLRLHRRITEAAQEWERSDRDSDLLYRGARLVQAIEWRDRNGPELNPLEREFLEESLSLQHRLERHEKERGERELAAALKLAETERLRAEMESKARRRQRSLIFALVGLLSLAGLIAAVAVWQGISARLAEQRTREVASLANLSLARYLKAAGNDAQALPHIAQALRLNQRNDEAAVLASAMLTQTRWPLLLTVPLRHEGPLRSGQFSPEGRRVLTASDDGTARLWDTATGNPIGEPMKHEGSVNFAQFSPDGRRLVTASRDKTAQLWDAVTGHAIGETMQHEKEVYSARFSPSGRRLVTASKDNTARIWDAATGEAIGEPMKHDGSVYSAQFSPDDRRVVTASYDGTARLWDAATGRSVGEPMKHDDWVNSAQFSPDGRRVVTASRDDTARIWDAATGKPIGEPMQNEMEVYSVRFSPDGRRVLTASKDRTARLWDAVTGKSIGEPMEHEGWVNSAEFSPDGQQVLTASEDDTARLWDVPAINTPASAEDVLLLADLAEATAGVALQSSGEAEKLHLLTPEQVDATRRKIAARFADSTAELTPLQRCLQWSVSDPRTRSFSPLSKRTVFPWVEERIKDGTVDGLRAAILVDPANMRLAAHFGRALADRALEMGTDPAESRRARAEADFQTRRAVQLAPENAEIKTIRDEVVRMLH